MNAEQLAQVDPQQVAQQMQQQQTLAMMQQLMKSLQKVCFERCISSPAASLSSRETACLKNCADRFLETQQVVKKTIEGMSEQQ